MAEKRRAVLRMVLALVAAGLFTPRLSGATTTDEAAAPANAITALDVDVRAPPQVFPAEGKQHLVYELHLSNFEKRTVALQAVEVLAADGPRKVLAHWSAAELEDMTIRRGSQSSDDVLKIPGGGTAVVFLWVTLDGAAQPPAALLNRLTVQEDGMPAPETFLGPPVAVNREEPIVIDPPLRGDRWAALNGPSNTSRHRRGLLTVDGRLSIGEKFATDWGRIAPNGELSQGDSTVNANYPYYGSPIYAVADGVVTEARDGIAENTPPNGPHAFATASDFAGNRIIEQIGPRRFALYAHLQNGSIRLKLGQKVHRGQVIGLLGNSGNSTVPHLHFHVCDANSALGCEGVPFVFRSFAVDGHVRSSSVTTEPPVQHRMEIPLEDVVVRFGP